MGSAPGFSSDNPILRTVHVVIALAKGPPTINAAQVSILVDCHPPITLHELIHGVGQLFRATPMAHCALSGLPEAQVIVTHRARQRQGGACHVRVLGQSQ